MPSIYLFQTDCAENNNAFFKAQTDIAVIFYRGAGLQIGNAPWIPDGVRVDLTEGPFGSCSLTLLELEAIRSEALKSSRKYLSEDRGAILSAFREYLRRKIADCKSTADPREESLVHLENAFRGMIPVIVKTAGALRSSTWNGPLEEESTITGNSMHYQPHDTRLDEDHTDKENTKQVSLLRGSLKLNRHKTEQLRRCVMILDALVRQDDHSSRTVRGWIPNAPLKLLLKQMSKKPSGLEKFISPEDAHKGIRLDFEVLLSDLIEIWSKHDEKIGLELGRYLISNYFPLVAEISGNEKMDRVFEVADTQIRIWRETQAKTPASSALHLDAPSHDSEIWPNDPDFLDLLDTTESEM